MGGRRAETRPGVPVARWRDDPAVRRAQRERCADGLRRARAAAECALPRSRRPLCPPPAPLPEREARPERRGRGRLTERDPPPRPRTRSRGHTGGQSPHRSRMPQASRSPNRLQTSPFLTLPSDRRRITLSDSDWSFSHPAVSTPAPGSEHPRARAAGRHSLRARAHGLRVVLAGAE